MPANFACVESESNKMPTVNTTFFIFEFFGCSKFTKNVHIGTTRAEFTKNNSKNSATFNR
jgi:hypothetical protein